MDRWTLARLFVLAGVYAGLRSALGDGNAVILAAVVYALLEAKHRWRVFDAYVRGSGSPRDGLRPLGMRAAAGLSRSAGLARAQV